MVSEFVSLVSLHAFQRKPLSLTKLIQQQASYSSLSFLHIHCITILSDNECLSHVCPSACIGSSSIVPFMCASFRECQQLSLISTTHFVIQQQACLHIDQSIKANLQFP